MDDGGERRERSTALTEGETMSEPYAQIARQAAAKLAESTTPQLPQLTEGVLAQGESAGRAQTYDAATAIGLASLLVSMAALAWTIYQDRKKAASPPRRDLIERQIRVQLEMPSGISVAQRDRMIAVVVEETVTYGNTQS